MNVQTLDVRIKILEESGHCFHRVGNTVAEKVSVDI